jgi:AraC-like DNA-binding protein
VSRATLAKRFADRVGEPPLTYLTRWRMTLAADLLLAERGAPRSPGSRAGSGYADPFGFSTAFTRVRGVTPSAFRRGERQGGRHGDRVGAPDGVSG